MPRKKGDFDAFAGVALPFGVVLREKVGSAISGMLTSSTVDMLRVRVSKIGKILQIFGRLVLGCIKTKFCKKICV